MSTSRIQLDDIDGLCNCLAVRQAARYLTAVYDQALSPVGLRITQFSILYKLKKNGPLVIGELASKMAMDRTTLSSNLKPLERDGLVDIVPVEDRRSRLTVITKAGLARFRKALPLWSDVQAKFEGAYGEKPASDLRNALRKVLDTGFQPWTENGSTVGD
jgi:DNA-binding MarR family transcriptional regulator